jgi:predicted phosphodiesterase
VNVRIAVLADIHGNLRALEAVRADLARYAPDLVVNLGDHLSGPLQAADTADLLMQQSYVQIRGNHDRQLLDRPPERMGLSDRAAHDQLDHRHRAWLESLPATQKIGEDVLLCHGSPHDDLEYLLENVVGDGLHLASSDLIGSRLGTAASPLVLCGHSHIPRTVLLLGGTWIVNPGSVGLPAYDDTWTAPHYVETGSPHARYAIIDRDRQTVRVDLIAVDYNWDAASKDAARANRPDWACALATGYALRR